jgi:hypothetical protein
MILCILKLCYCMKYIYAWIYACGEQSIAMLVSYVGGHATYAGLSLGLSGVLTVLLL